MAKTKAEKPKKQNRIRTKLNIPQALYDRARKQIGMSVEKIASYPDAKSLKAYCDKVSPRTNMDARPKRGKVSVPERKIAPIVPDKFEFDSKMEVSKFQNRTQFDNANLQAELRRINRVHEAQPVRIITDSGMKPVQGKNKFGQSARLLVTHYTIIMKE